MILSIAPDLVDMDKAVAHFVEFPDTGTPLFFFGAAMTAWLSRDWSKSGVFGDATLGTAEKGAQIIDALATRMAALLTAISRFEVPA